jgi:flavin reductase (DIM6/NTAB) family NADH-FMN oxidoreductase RutF
LRRIRTAVNREGYVEQDYSGPSTASERNLLSFFWTPLVAIGSSTPTQVNAQISVSTFGASIVPERPRLLSVLYKTNFTHELVEAKGSFSVSVLSEAQIGLLPALGFRSGRQQDKLRGFNVEVTALGNPVFPDSLGWLDCQVIDSYSLGDATAFLGAVIESRNLNSGPPLLWSEARKTLPAEWADEWERKQAENIAASLRTMHWLD